MPISRENSVDKTEDAPWGQETGLEPSRNQTGTKSGIESPIANKMSVLKGGMGFSSTECASQFKLCSSKGINSKEVHRVDKN